MTNNILTTDLSLWTPLFTEDARRQACVQYRGRCYNCGSTAHSLRWCPAPFKSTFSLLNPEFGTRDPDGSGVRNMENTHAQLVSKCRHPRDRQDNNRHNGSCNGRPRYTQNRGHSSTYHGMTRANPPVATRNFRQRSNTPQYAPPGPNLTMRHAPTPTGLPNASNHQLAPPYEQHDPTP